MQMREILEESTEEWKDGGREENRTEKREGILHFNLLEIMIIYLY